jgi:EAL domain-containing protein (putative c-di-GMP-specific phosphodiesterase class I)
METNNRLIVMDDEPGIRDFVKNAAMASGFEAIAPRNAKQFMEAVQEQVPDLIVLDLHMPDVDGVELLRWLGEQRCDAAVVLMSGTDRRILDSARRLAEGQGVHISSVLEKPIRLEQLEQAFNTATPKSRQFTTLELQHALHHRQLQVHYLPKVTLDGGDVGHWKVVEAEALVRWQHPHHGLLMPIDFIQMAEDSGNIMAVTDAVADVVLGRLKLWRANDLSITAAINLPTAMLEDLEFPDRLEEMVLNHDLEPSCLSLEVTENCAMSDVTRAMDIFTRLRLKGFLLSVDDFGTGFSSLSQLHEMPFSEIKIDRSFTKEMSQNQDARTIVGALVSLGNNLGMKVCAEGIEDAETLEILRDIGCGYGQGFYFSPAVPSTELVSLLLAWADESGTAELPQS